MSTAFNLFGEFLVSMTAAQKALRTARIFHIALLAATIANMALPLLIDFGIKQQIGSIFPLALGATSVVILGVAIFLRRSRITPAEEILRSNPEDNATASRWRGGVVVSLVFCESIVLYGLVLRILGAPWAVGDILCRRDFLYAGVVATAGTSSELGLPFFQFKNLISTPSGLELRPR
jgi:hypothetical protein